MSKKKRGISIRAKLLVALLVVFMIPVSTVMYLLNLRLQTSFDNIARDRVKNALEGIKNDYESLLDSTRKRVETISLDRFIINDVASYRYYALDLISRIEMVRKTSGLDVLKVVDEKYRLIADGSNPVAFDAENEFSYLGDPYITEVLEKSISKVALRREKGRDRKYVSIISYNPVKYEYTKSIDAVILGGVYIDEEYIDKLHRLSSAKVVLYEGYRPTLSSDGENPENSLPVGREFLQELDDDPYKLVTVSDGNNSYMVGGVPLRDISEGTPQGYFVIGINIDSVNEIVKRTRKDMIYVLLIGLVISFVVSIIMSVGITRPISRLVRSARLIGRGEFEGAETPVRSRDEIGLLAETMNRMVKDLRDYSNRIAMTERVAAWREIARRIAHEIKNPLSPIQLSIENLKATYQEDRETFDMLFTECSDTVLEEVDKLRKLANEFSEFAQMPDPIFEEVDISEMLNNLVKFYNTVVPDGVDINYFSDDESIFVRADRDQLNRVFTNLIKNAVEALDSKGKLEISTEVKDKEIVVIIEDNGKGIPAEELDKIFTPYYTTKSGGTGLGLSIVKRILRDHGAVVNVESIIEEGSKFTIIFKS